MRELHLLGVRVCATDYDEACEAVRVAAVTRSPFTVTALAVHGVMTGALDPLHRQRLNTLDMVVPDGQPVRWGLNLLFGAGLRDRVCGPKLMLQVCAMCAQQGLRIAFYGNKQAVLDELCGNLRATYPGLDVAAAIPSRFGRVSQAEQVALAEQISASGANIVFVGLGCPRQEVWLFENRALLRMPTIAVGAAFDFHAKRARLAPVWMQDAGLEWLYRFWHEPRRLWRRYLLLNPLYLMMLALQKIGLKRFAVRDEPSGVPYEGYA